MFYLCEAVSASPLPVPAEKVRDEIHPQHVVYVAEGVEKGIVVFGGPKSDNAGGVILVKAPSLAACQAFLDGDPMRRAGASEYRVTEFLIKEHAPCLDPLLDSE